MLARYVDVCSPDAVFEPRPVALNRVGMDRLPDVFALAVVDAIKLVGTILLERVVAAEFVGNQDATALDR